MNCSFYFLKNYICAEFVISLKVTKLNKHLKLYILLFNEF